MKKSAGKKPRRGRALLRRAAARGSFAPSPKGSPPWYHRLSPLTWGLLVLLLAVSASVALRSARGLRPLPRPTQVQVLNGSGAPDLARTVTDRLRDRGLDVVAVGNADASDYPQTLVLLRRGDLGVARMVAQRLGAGVPLLQRDPTLLVDVTVILGRDLLERTESLAQSGGERSPE